MWDPPVNTASIIVKGMTLSSFFLAKDVYIRGGWSKISMLTNKYSSTTFRRVIYAHWFASL